MSEIEREPYTWVSSGREFDRLRAQGQFKWLAEVPGAEAVRKCLAYALVVSLTDSVTEQDRAQNLLDANLAAARNLYDRARVADPL